METANGFALMRMEAVLADEAVKFETTTTPSSSATTPCRYCYCSSEEDEGSGDDDNEEEGEDENANENGSGSEKPLVSPGGEEDGDSISLASLLDRTNFERPAPTLQPPPPPPRQSVRASMSSVSILSGESVSVGESMYRGSTSSLQRGGTASTKTSEGDESTLSGDDFTAKSVGEFALEHGLYECYV